MGTLSFSMGRHWGWATIADRRCWSGSGFFQSLDPIAHQVHLHVDTINFIDAIGKSLKLSCNNFKIPMVMLGSFVGQWFGSQVVAYFIDDSNNAAYFLMKSTDSGV